VYISINRKNEEADLEK